jgi:hypothetical protein
VDGIECFRYGLIWNERTIEIIDSDNLNKIGGKEVARIDGVTITNPVMSVTLGKFYEYANLGFLQNLWCYAASALMTFLVGVGIYFQHWLLCIIGIGFYIILRIIHRDYE